MKRILSIIVLLVTVAVSYAAISGAGLLFGLTESFFDYIFVAKAAIIMISVFVVSLIWHSGLVFFGNGVIKKIMRKD